jgi:hypothetical protein
MFKEKPALGYGYGGFNANYMNFQARYFEAHPDSKYARIADNVRNPFNEYVKLLVNYGFAGLVAFLTLCSFLYLSFRRIKNKTITDYAALYALEAIAVFAFFSYPLTYPFVLIVGTVNVLLIYSRAEYKLKKTPPVWVNICVIALIAAIAVFTANKMEEQMQWASIARKSLKGQTEEMLSEYERLYKTMKNNDLFMYNYAAELNTAGYPDESIKIALECERMLADYDLQMLLAENYRQLKRYREAEQRYQFASLMCPVKFAPLYELAKMYEESGDIHRAKLLAEQILKKQVKIHSTQIEKMKKEMKALLDMYIQ